MGKVGLWDYYTIGHDRSSFGLSLAGPWEANLTAIPGRLSRMHCMIAWGVANGGTPLSSSDHQVMMGAFEGQDSLLVFPGVAVVTLADDAGRLALQEKLVETSKNKLGGRAVFVMSPLMAPGTGIYRGFIPQTLWEPLNKKTV